MTTSMHLPETTSYNYLHVALTSVPNYLPARRFAAAPPCASPSLNPRLTASACGRRARTSSRNTPP
eukprot:6183558-Pleurochrysis_carterae.AAC.2